MKLVQSLRTMALTLCILATILATGCCSPKEEVTIEKVEVKTTTMEVE